MFPLRDDNPQFLTPYVTYGLIAVNVCVWLVIQGLGFDPALSRSVCTLGLIPAELSGAVPAGTALPLSDTTVCMLTPDWAWLSLASYMFLHGSWLHIIFNMWFLWIFGNNVEDSMGHLRFFFFYLLCGLIAAGLQVVSDAQTTAPIVGASGAVGGVMGAYILLYPRVNVHFLIFLGFFVTTIAVPAFWMLAYWFILQVLGAVTSTSGESGVAFWAHVGGFVAGAALVTLFRKPELVARHPYHGWKPQTSAPPSWRKVPRD